MNEEEKGILEEKLIKCYGIKGITFSDDSLYKIKKIKGIQKKIFKESKDMPILEDLYNILGDEEITRKFKTKLIPFVRGSLKFFNHITNIKINSKIIVADIYELGEENIKYGMYVFIDLFYDLIKKDRKIKKAIYLDEIWRLIRGNIKLLCCKFYL